MKKYLLMFVMEKKMTRILPRPRTIYVVLLKRELGLHYRLL